jgi:hypothetical protein
MPAQIDGRLVYVRTGPDSQTINVCDDSNIHGRYERRFRLRPVNEQYRQEQMVAEINRRGSAGDTIEQLAQWLVDNLGAVCELGPGAPIAADGVGDEPADIPEHLAANQPQPWFTHAVWAVERAINDLVDEFTKFPYMHRVEHCLHTRLVQLLRHQWPIGGTFALGNTGAQTQLVHKEWPATRAFPGRRRGSFDVAILSPQVVSDCQDLQAFSQGLLPASIAIEVGLNYGVGHLSDDEAKLAHCRVPAAYLLHFVRSRSLNQREREVLYATPKLPSGHVIKKACAVAFGANRWTKHVEDDVVQGAQ